ncbi:phosphate butyryltransferase [Salsuginibacillus halophilus]|uniref:Phosphate butyryltransferase n=2 Tax=Salsuginibacillus halophilus TaxID=517424 RepID=A0A2P8HXZ4_9BACI|nr:phosphate butyryltransferase [Salsuginibacillus halophilus]
MLNTLPTTNGRPVTLAIAGAADDHMLEVVEELLQNEDIYVRLYGEETMLEKAKDGWHEDLSARAVIIPTRSEQEASRLAVMAVSDGKASVLVKGMVQTAALMKEVVNRDYGLRRPGRTLSHVAQFALQDRSEPLFVTDAGMNVTPDLQTKVQITENAVETAHLLGVECPKVAALAAVETINPEMPATVDAASLTQMNRRGQITGCIIDGPLALDNAVSKAAAEKKKLSGGVAGEADILLVPHIEVGNVLYKSLVHFGGAQVGGVIAGAAAPIVVTSRSDSLTNKLHAAALGIQMHETAQQRRYNHETI